MGWLRSRSLEELPATLVDQLMLGGTLFKIGCVVLGLLLIGMGRFNVWEEKGSGDQQDHHDKRHSYTWMIMGLIGCATALRLYDLGSGLWHDEIVTYINYTKLPFGDIVTTFDSQNQHPLYSLLAHVSIKIFGDSVWSLRFPAAIFGVGSILAVYLLGRHIANEREAILSAGLLVFSYHHIWFSQNARGYTGVLFWTLLSSWLLLRALEEKRPQVWIWYAITSALGVYTHLTMVFVIFAQFFIFFWSHFLRPRMVSSDWLIGVVCGFSLAGVLTFLLHSLALPQILVDMLGETSTVAVWKHPMWAILQFINGMQLGFNSMIVGGIALVVFVLGVVSYGRTCPALLQLLFIPVLTCGLLSIILGHHLWPRLFFFAIGFGALVAIRGIMVVAQSISLLVNISAAKAIKFGIMLCVSIIVAAGSAIPAAFAPKQDYQGARTFVEGNRAPGDAVVTLGLATFSYQKYLQTSWEEAPTLEALNVIRLRSKRTWVVYTFPPHMREVYPAIMSSLHRDFKVLKKFQGTLKNGAIVVCRSDVLPLLGGTIKSDGEVNKKSASVLEGE
jgi:hypothetical protein